MFRSIVSGCCLEGRKGVRDIEGWYLQACRLMKLAGALEGKEEREEIWPTLWFLEDVMLLTQAGRMEEGIWWGGCSGNSCVRWRSVTGLGQITCTSFVGEVSQGI